MEKINEMINDLKNIVNNAKKEMEGIKKADKFVLIYKNKENNMFYGMTKTDINQITKEHKNIIPSPSPNNVKVMSYNEADEQCSLIPSIKNGSGEEFHGYVVIYPIYLNYYIKDVEKSYNDLINAVNKMKK